MIKKEEEQKEEKEEDRGRAKKARLLGSVLREKIINKIKQNLHSQERKRESERRVKG